MIILVTSFHVLFWGSCPTGSANIYFTSGFIGLCVCLIGFNLFGCFGKISSPIRCLRSIGYLIGSLDSIRTFIDSTKRLDACTGYSGRKRSDYCYSINPVRLSNDIGTFPLRIQELHRIPGAICIRTERVVLLRQRIGAGEHPGGGLPAGDAVIPVYAKERFGQFLACVKIVGFVLICNSEGGIIALLPIRQVVELLQDVAVRVGDGADGAQVVGCEVVAAADLILYKKSLKLSSLRL